MIASVDTFVLYDTVQYTRRDWRNRNKIKTRDGLRWITVPVQVKGRYLQTIDETELAGEDWKREHLAAIRHSYVRCAAFDETFAWLEELIYDAPSTTIAALNRHMIEACCRRLDISTQIRLDSEFVTSDGRNERLADLCRELGATEYVSGPAAKNYLDESVFSRHGIRVLWKSYAGYVPYEQPYPPFEHSVSIVDLLCCTGDNARSYLRSEKMFES